MLSFRGGKHMLEAACEREGASVSSFALLLIGRGAFNGLNEEMQPISWQVSWLRINF